MHRSFSLPRNRFLGSGHDAQHECRKAAPPQFKAAMQPALDAHARVVDQRKQLRISILERNGAVRKAMQLVYLIGFATRGDPEHGPNSDLYDALGYTREAVRRTKIRRTRRRKRAPMARVGDK